MKFLKKFIEREKCKIQVFEEKIFSKFYLEKKIKYYLFQIISSQMSRF